MTETPAAASRGAVWTRHWASGSPHSCGGSYGEVYGGAIAAFWGDVLESVSPGCRVLDLATGSAALPRLFLRMAPHKQLHIDAVDLSTVQPVWLRDDAAARDTVQFHGGVSIEALPFGAESFDLVVSQFGLEYAGPDALDELCRVRAPGARTALVVHHADARPVRLAAVELKHLDWLTGPSGLLHVARAMTGLMARAGTAEGRASLASDTRALATRDRFNAAQRDLEARYRAHPDGADVLLEVRDAVARALSQSREGGDAAAANVALDALASTLDDARWRLEDLVACALDEPRVRALSARICPAGQRSELQPLIDAGHLMGWALRVAP